MNAIQMHAIDDDDDDDDDDQFNVQWSHSPYWLKTKVMTWPSVGKSVKYGFTFFKYNMYIPIFFQIYYLLGITLAESV